MSQFEYIMVMVSLILALAVAQALRGLSEVVASAKRHTPHTVWIAYFTLLIIQNWWAYWDYNNVEEWRFTTYLFVLLGPIIFFASVYLLVPTTRTSDIDWREHLSTVTPWVGGLGVISVAAAVAANVIYFDSPLLHPYRIFQALFGALYLAGIFAKNEKVQSAIPYLLLLTLITSQLVIRSKIGALIAN